MDEVVYKFLPSNRGIQFLEDGWLRFSQPGAMNDPFECLCFEDPDMAEEVADTIQQEELRRLESNKTLSSKQKVVNRLQIGLRKRLRIEDAHRNREVYSLEDQKYLIGLMNREIGILSLTSRWDSSLMWSHYTDRHRGVCVGFNASHAFFTDEHPSAKKLKKVEYVTERQKLFDKEDFKNKPSLMFWKSNDWAYEKEQRMIVRLDCQGDIPRKSCGLDQFGLPVELFQIPTGAILEVLLGMEASSETERKAREAASRLNVPVFKTKPSFTSLSLERVRL